MRVLLLNQYYHPDVAPTAQFAADLGEDLARRGHEVTAIASARPYAGSRERLASRDRHAGVEIRRVAGTAFGRAHHLGRVADYATFLLQSVPVVTAAARPDVVVALSTPPLVAALGMLTRKLHGSRLVYWVMDVYPEVAVELGVMRRNSAATRAVARLSRAVLDRADAIVALDDSMRDRLIAAGGDRSRIEVIDNWCDGASVRPTAAESNALRRELGLQGVFTVSYSGNMGIGHDFDTLLGAMWLLRNEEVHWLLIGDGPQRARLQAEVRALDVRRVTWLSYQQRAALPVTLTAADASLVCLGAGLGGLLVPSKLYGILAAGLPVIYIGPPEGRVAEVIREHDVGIAVRNGDAAALASAIRRLRDDRARRHAIGQRGRQLFEQKYDRPLALERHHQLLCRVGGQPC
jgi:glycosyltransferase involved in cell wall biosynthesis